MDWIITEMPGKIESQLDNEAERKTIDPVITWCPDYCKACYTCINICPEQNLEFQDDEMVSLGKCIQCQLCMKYCPDFSLEVIPKPKKTPAGKSPLPENEGGKK